MTRYLLTTLLMAGIVVLQSDRGTPCSSLSKLQLPDVRIMTATAVPAVTSGRTHAPHCRVEGVIGAEIRFAVLLPDQWNGKFFMGGGGGFRGSLENAAESTLDQGYATAGTDTGHRDDGLSARWALGNAERQVNFGHVAVHRTAETAKAIIRHHYGTPPVRSYFGGCSRGGGEAVTSAIRYPADFDGIVAGAPVLDWTATVARFMSDTRAAFPDRQNPTTAVLRPETLKFVEARILSACDATDGVADGILADPRQCRFDIESLPACPADAEGPTCVSSRQRTALKSIYGPLRDREGVIHPGRPFGGEGDPQGWPGWISGMPDSSGRVAPNRPPMIAVFGSEFFKYFVFGDPAWEPSRFDLSTVRKDVKPAAGILDATNPDLDRFKAGGGRMILYHGWSDPALPALDSIRYYEAVAARDRNVREYFRMFLMPGVLHCFGGPGADNVDWVTPIEEWVEHNRPPDRVIARKTANGTETRSRPLCPYPQRAEYRGTGSTDDESNFLCR